jgi:hypothetical protein
LEYAGLGSGATFAIETEKVPENPTVEFSTPEQFTTVGPVTDYQGEKPEEGSWTRDLLAGYFNLQSVSLDFWAVRNPVAGTLVDPKTGMPSPDGIPFDPTTMLRIEFAVKPADYGNFDFMDILQNARHPIRITDAKQKSVLIQGLMQNSDYEFQLLVNSVSSEPSLVVLKATTDKDTNPQQLPVAPLGPTLSDSLKNFSW